MVVTEVERDCTLYEVCTDAKGTVFIIEKTVCVLCDVLHEAEETDEHQEYKTTKQPDGGTLMK
jgi:hypothetical protein